jgi:hypothetical protein
MRTSDKKWQMYTNVTRVINYNNAYAPKALTGYGGMVTGHWDLDHRRFHLGVFELWLAVQGTKVAEAMWEVFEVALPTYPSKKKWFTLERQRLKLWKKA